MKVLICTNFKKEKSRRLVPSVVEKLLLFGIVPLMNEKDRDFFDCGNVVYDKLENQIAACDIFLTIGGDGTILRWGKRAAKTGKSLLGINTGRLGFMATLECDELDKLKKLVDGDYSISSRMLMNVLIKRGNGDLHFSALNDVVFYKDSGSKLPEFRVESNNAEVSNIRADGMIFSTPTGSTAYALSAGGPIIDPSLRCIEMTPLCAHTLFSRPMIFGGDTELKVVYSGYESSRVYITIDGDDGISFEESDSVIITKSELALNLIDLDGDSFYSSIHNKLMRPLK